MSTTSTTSKPRKPRASAASIDKEIAAAQKALGKQIKTLAKLRRKAPPREVEDATFEGPGGKKLRLGDLFDGRDELVLIHNMGRGCAYCTFWADGFNGLRAHLENRAAFVLVSPDAPDKQADFAKSRGWSFRMVRDPSGSFSAAMGYGGDGGISPGVSTFRKRENGRIERFAHTPFGPGDLYNPAFHLFDLLPGTGADWAPKFKYR